MKRPETGPALVYTERVGSSNLSPPTTQRNVTRSVSSAISVAQRHLRLFQKPQKRPAGLGIQFLGIQRPVIVRVGGFETLLDDSKIFFLRKCSVVIGVGGGEFCC